MAPKMAHPMLMVHGVRVSASNYEFRKNFEFFTQVGYRVYALDLLGFGLSDRPAITYTNEVYVALIRDFVRDVIDQKTHVMASGLSAAFMIVAADRHPELFGSLILIEPIGITQNHYKVPIVSDVAPTPS